MSISDVSRFTSGQGGDVSKLPGRYSRATLFPILSLSVLCQHRSQCRVVQCVTVLIIINI
ncbi:hypothetical protein E2C01_095602 [Portunus trituberculatus]|uniref:Uncharacterized protein n=1 Tax=Portunus trituberculatus TaxID=210409 RepID=A0A5B7K4G1_PORTR|nr:hypothetical protein [Portunus trituberculatus]